MKLDANTQSRSLFESALALFTTVRPGEGRSVRLLLVNGFLVLTAYYILKTLREPLLLTEFDAQTRSYAIAVVAIVLFFMMPLYGVVFRHTNRTQLVHWINAFFIANLLIFLLLHFAGIPFGFSYYVWVGIFGVMVVAQFWAYVTDIYNVKAGQRLFPIIMVGTTLGALCGAKLTDLTYNSLGWHGLVGLATLLLGATMFLYRPARLAAPDESRCVECEFIRPKFEFLFGGLAIVLEDRYLRLIALFVVLLNWINSTGEYILAEVVVAWADALVAAGSTTQTKDALLASFYGNFNFTFALLGLLLQVFVVARLFRYLGVAYSILILPAIAALGYGLVLFIPVFTVIHIVKLLENGVDYSLMNTLRHALFLPTSREVKYEGKTAVDTFFWRFGDLIQAALIYIGINWYQWGTTGFAAFNFALTIVWLGVGLLIGREYKRMIGKNATNTAPELARPIPDVTVAAHRPLDIQLEPDTFIDKDPGDTLTLSAQMTDGRHLPEWLHFDADRARFFGSPPNVPQNLEIEVRARDFEGLEANGRFTLSLSTTEVSQTGTFPS